MDDPILQAAKKWEECWMRIGMKEKELFEANSVGYTDSLIVLNARRKLMVWIYCLLRNYGKLPAIESLEKEDKEKMWLFVHEICVGKNVDVKKKKEICIVFYTIEYFLNKKNENIT